jgi:branched-chain amino acid aminotransferase
VEPGGALCTPPLDEHILASITRQRVMSVADVEERPCTLDDLRSAGEAFLTSTTREVQPIVAVDDIVIPEGERTREVGRALWVRIQEELGG